MKLPISLRDLHFSSCFSQNPERFHECFLSLTSHIRSNMKSRLFYLSNVSRIQLPLTSSAPAETEQVSILIYLHYFQGLLTASSSVPSKPHSYIPGPPIITYKVLHNMALRHLSHLSPSTILFPLSSPASSLAFIQFPNLCYICL